MQPKTVLLAALMIAGCDTTALETDTCGASDYAMLLGTPVAAVTLPARLEARVIGPDSAVTADFDPGRLNLEVDGDGIVIGVTCG